ncbi:uncharacterized protein LOC116417087 [Nasonia vitripennis]|uniref:Uncharacterized protein n=1 Tax=Nasonia vitripennis TaxID=7425 RepID=A0A7M7Q9F9_NASVI|nr:uncharacterized protein LOC116417087 [Nasonia vitripennis]
MGYINRRSTVKSTFEQSSLKITCLWRRNQDSLNISKMDLSALNKIAEREFLPKKKATNFQTRFSTKIVAEIDDSFQIFLPEKISSAILKDQELFNNLSNTANKLSLFITVGI